MSKYPESLDTIAIDAIALITSALGTEDNGGDTFNRALELLDLRDGESYIESLAREAGTMVLLATIAAAMVEALQDVGDVDAELLLQRLALHQARKMHGDG